MSSTDVAGELERELQALKEESEGFHGKLQSWLEMGLEHAPAPPTPAATSASGQPDRVARGSGSCSTGTPNRLLLQTLKQGSTEWHQARKGRLTASRFGTATGVCPYATPKDLWGLMTGSIAADEKKDSAPMVRSCLLCCPCGA